MENAPVNNERRFRELFYRVTVIGFACPRLNNKIRIDDISAM